MLVPMVAKAAGGGARRESKAHLGPPRQLRITAEARWWPGAKHNSRDEMCRTVRTDRRAAVSKMPKVRGMKRIGPSNQETQGTCGLALFTIQRPAHEWRRMAVMTRTSQRRVCWGRNGGGDSAKGGPQMTTAVQKSAGPEEARAILAGGRPVVSVSQVARSRSLLLLPLRGGAPPFRELGGAWP